MENSLNITIKIIAPDTHQLMRSVRTIESLNPFYIEGKVFSNDKDNGAHLFLTLPLNWFIEAEKRLVEYDLKKYAVEPNSQEQPYSTPTVNRLNGCN